MTAQELELQYYPPQLAHVSDADYQKGYYYLENTYAAIADDDQEVTYADYWNIALAYSYMGQPPEKVYQLLQASYDESPQSFCELLEYLLAPGKQGADQLFYYKLLGEQFTELVSACAGMEIPVYNRAYYEERKPGVSG